MKASGRFFFLWMTLLISMSTLNPQAIGEPATSDPGSGRPAHDWPQFRGPDRSGISEEVGLRRSWPEGGPPVLWRRPLGEGFSGIVVSGDYLYTLYAVGDDEFARCFRVTDGSEVWRYRIGDTFLDEWGNGPRSTPTIDGHIVYILSPRGMLFAMDDKLGEVIWHVDITARYGRGTPLFDMKNFLPPEEGVGTGEFGHSSSPLIDGDLLIVYTGAGDGKSLVALDKHTGETRWTALNNETSHSSPIGVSIAGQRQIIMLLPGEIIAMQPSGQVLWRHPWARAVLSQPVFVPPDKIFSSTIYDVGTLLLQVRTTRNNTGVEILWQNRLMRNCWSSSVLYEGHLFGFDNATLRCLSLKTGELRWAKRGLGRGSVVIIDGLLILLGDHGILTLAEASSESYRETGRIKLFAGPSWTAPTPVQGKLFLRNQEEMICLNLRD